MPTARPNLRFATPSDAGTILGFIRELADFEKLSHEVVASEDGLRAALFTGRSATEVILAEVAGKPVGFMLFFQSFSTFLGRAGLYLEDLYVTPAHRGQGIGKTMLTSLGKLAAERGAGRLEWSVLDWNAAAIGFYESLGARPMEGWTVCRLTGDALTKVAGDPAVQGIQPA